MAYITEEARQELVDSVAEAAVELATALAMVGAAYEELDEQSGDTLEEELFRPLQVAYGRAQRTVTSFAERHRLSVPDMTGRDAGLVSRGVKELIADGVEAVEVAEAILTELQDSLSPVEVGDTELRAGLADVRERMSALPARAERFISRFGR
jgi:hypothetical protein